MERIERIERATLDAVRPQQVQELPGWLLPMDPGTVGRAHSAVPLQHVPPTVEELEGVAQCYVQNGWHPVLRLPDLPAWMPVNTQLLERGWHRSKPTCVMTAAVTLLAQRAVVVLPADVALHLTDSASAEWTALFLGPGMDPVDGASRARALARSHSTRFLRVDWAGRTVACGAVCFSQCTVSAHGLRTALSHRGRGLATAMLGAMASEAKVQGLSDAFLQVEASNPAKALYERLGFEVAWQYAYWHAPA